MTLIFCQNEILVSYEIIIHIDMQNKLFLLSSFSFFLIDM